jgi:hypothetical protein
MFRFASSRHVDGAGDRRCDVMREAKFLASAVVLLGEIASWIPSMTADDEVTAGGKQRRQQGNISIKFQFHIRNIRLIFL